MSEKLFSILEKKPMSTKNRGLHIKIKSEQPTELGVIFEDRRDGDYNGINFRKKMREKYMKTQTVVEKLIEKEKVSIKKPKKRIKIKKPKKKRMPTEEFEKQRRKAIKVKGKHKQFVEIKPEAVKLHGEALIKRLPKNTEKINIRTSNYYMNNREIFTSFINNLLKPYKEVEMSEQNKFSCDNKGDSGKGYSLMKQQQIVRDYMNLYTPYRGLLLYHGLGAGKTCASIGIAEGLKSANPIVVMTPASLKDNYVSELKKCGDIYYRLKQYWEFVTITDNNDLLNAFSELLHLPKEYIQKKKGVWFIDINKESNYDTLSNMQKFSLDDQINVMILRKYHFISYNGLRQTDLEREFGGERRNPFNNKTIIIDEAHNFISSIANKLKKPKSLSYILYQKLMNAENCKIIFLTGTPIVNYPNELAILYNILRGHIKSISFKLDKKTPTKVSEEIIKEWLKPLRLIDLIEFNGTEFVLTLVRNPLGFINNENNGKYVGVSKVENSTLTTRKLKNKIKRLLSDNKVDVIKITDNNYEALPSNLDKFKMLFVNENGTIKNINLFKKRIMGLTSYFRSAKEELMPSYNEETDFSLINIEMSDYQFKEYEKYRKEERDQKKRNQLKKKKAKEGDVYSDGTSTYRIFSRASCNFVFPENIKRPMPIKGNNIKTIIDDKNVNEDILDATTINEKLNAVDGKYDISDVKELEKNKLVNNDVYKRDIRLALMELEKGGANYFSEEKLAKYSPKFLQILKNVQDEKHEGLHLLYSNFKTLEGIGILKLILEYHGWAEFKIKKNSKSTWLLDIKEEDMDKPKFCLFTGTGQSREEKEYLRRIYNGEWANVPTTITDELNKMNPNNLLGEIIKLFMITASGAEGITLRNCRHVHVTESYWHPVRMEQVIGRARRICSHQDLPKKFRNVKVFMYLMTFSKKQLESEDAVELKIHDGSRFDENIPVSSDYALYEISLQKAKTIQSLLKAVKESSIDCAIHSLSNKKEGLVCYNVDTKDPEKTSYKATDAINDEKDAIADLNKETKKWKGKVFQVNKVKYLLKPTTNEVYTIDGAEQLGELVNINGKQKLKLF
ncbi:MAG: hypothetical protein CML42_00510 [Rhodobacteraceae bacterium]|nr:hypothetical protein [Paracoccaceae bacterium]|tara:strand:+ start:11931 stop:15149 length:3219 start_codon:yes stop_codon:yes gene_type:complete